MSSFFSVEGAFAYFTECNLATLERLRSLSRTPKSELQRQLNICNEMIAVCRDFGIEPNRTNVRLNEALRAQVQHSGEQQK